METMSLTLRLSENQYEQLVNYAKSRHLEVTELAIEAIAEWLERQARLAQARARMQEFGKGLGAGEPKANAAQHHDKVLYPSNEQ
jgi:hypothetical protein